MTRVLYKKYYAMISHWKGDEFFVYYDHFTVPGLPRSFTIHQRGGKGSFNSGRHDCLPEHGDFEPGTKIKVFKRPQDRYHKFRKVGS